MARTRPLRIAGAGLVAVAIVSAWVAFTDRLSPARPIESLQALEEGLESLRGQLRIPGMSAAIAENDRIIWAKGFGWANRERAAAAGPETIYHLASVTKPYGATVVLQLVDEGKLSLDDPVSRFGITTRRSAPVRIWHLLSHTSGDPPGTRYRYDGNAFGSLTQVIERSTGHPFTTELVNRIVRPLGLTRTSPNPGNLHQFWSMVASVTVSPEDIARAHSAFAASGLNREPIEADLAQGYARAWGRWIWPTGLVGPMRAMPNGFVLSTTAGLVASAPDVARFSIALDQGRLSTAASRTRAWEPLRAPDGRMLPYALGWFVQDALNHRIVWHYGHGFESSSLIVRIPADRMTFVILANSDGLSRWRRLGDRADVTASPAAKLFLNWYSVRSSRSGSEK